MPTIPRLLERYQNRVYLNLRTGSDVRSYSFIAYQTLDAAYTGGGTAMFSVRAGKQFRSPAVVRRGHGLNDESTRGLTTVMYDPTDYASGSVPADGEIAFLRVVENTLGGVARAEGPILIVPAPGFFGSYRPSLTVGGTAPNVAGLASGLPPATAMHFALPRYADAVSIMNSGSVDLLVSFAQGQPEITVPAGEQRSLPDAVVSEVFVRGNSGTAAFSMYFAVVSGAME